MKNRLHALRLRLRVSKREAWQGVAIGVLFSMPIYLAWGDITHPFLGTLLAVAVFYLLIGASQGMLLVAGFTIGLLWFYWVGFSFRFVDMAYVVPLVPWVFGVVYGAVFWAMGFARHPLVRALLLWLLSFYNPFYFNWFKPEVLLVNSYFGVARWQYGVLLAVLALLFMQKTVGRKMAVALLLLGALSWQKPTVPALPWDVSVTQTSFDQHTKWNPAYRLHYLAQNFDLIEVAIADGKNLVILPESTFPLYLNRYPETMSRLKALSHQIAIITGALLVEGDATYNATYFFQNGAVTVAKKMVLVPFGEYIPLPKFLRDWINDLIFQGGADFHTATAPTDFVVAGVKLRNAICYEASSEVFYKDAPPFLVATSNNAWFAPSIEPVLQKLLITLYAKRYNTVVLHSVNGASSAIIYP